jgi:membrane protease YdiL (CAAX protease family)
MSEFNLQKGSSFIENALTVKNNFWRYVLGIFIIFIFTQIGSIPFIVAIFNKVGLEGAADLDPSTMMTILENSNLTFFYTLFTFFVGFIGFIIVIKYLHNQSILSITSSRKTIDYKRILTSFTAISTILVLNILFSFLITPEDYILQFNLNDFLILLLIAVIFIPIQTSLEEYIFRGYLMQGIGIVVDLKKSLYHVIIVILCAIIYMKFLYFEINFFEILLNVLAFLMFYSIVIFTMDSLRVSNKILKSSIYIFLYEIFRRKSTPLLITSLTFGFLHFYNPEIMKLGSILLVHYVATGLFLGIITLMDDGTELALGFHAGNNLLIALIVTADWTVFQTTSILKYIGEPNVINQSLFSLSIIYPILLFYFSRKYNWTNWKDKLTGKVK